MRRTCPLPPGLLMLVTLLALAAVGLARAQSLVVEAPPGRLAQPGDYVTLVFQVRSSADLTVALDTTAPAGWQLLGPASTVALHAGVSEPVAITVAVPADASASIPAEVTLTAVGGGQQTAASTRIDVAPRLELRLVTPKQVAVGDTLTATVQNAGNVPATATLTVTVDQQVVGSTTVTAQPGKSADATFPVRREAQYKVTLSRSGTVLAVRFVDTVVHGAPTPSTFTLSGAAHASLDNNLSWQGSVDLKGALSDYTNLDLRLQADRPLASHVRLRSSLFGVSVGDFWSDPLGLSTMDGFGVSALWTPGRVALEGDASWLQSDQFAGRLQVGYRRTLENVSLVGSIGMRAGHLTAAGTMRGAVEGGHAQFGVSYDGQRMAASYDMSASDATGSYRAEASALDIFTPYGRFTASVSYRSGRTSIFAGGTAPLGDEAAGQAQVGASTRVSVIGHGSLDGAVTLGEPESRAVLTYGTDLRQTFRPSLTAGVVYRTDGPGWGVTTDARLDVGRAGKAEGWTGSLEARGQYYPSTDMLRGRVSARVLGNEPPLTLFASSGWALDTGSVGVGTGAIYSNGPWTLQANAGVTYAPGSIGAWSGQLQLQGRYAFDVAVPEGLVQAAGGRRLGTLEVQVLADGRPLDGVGLTIGRYLLDTGADGVATIHLPPGNVAVSVDLSKLAANLQLDGSGTRTVAVNEGTTTSVHFALRRTAAVRGHVLVDSNGDGKPDPGAKGVQATLIVDDALGQGHRVTTSPDGGYVVRGLPAGKTTVSVEQTPAGSVVVGSPRHDLALTAGETAVADFLVQPAASRATVFGSSELRIRSIDPEIGRVPPGAAPLLTITTVGEPDRVSLTVDGGSFPAKRLGPDTWRLRVPVPQAAKGILDASVRAVKGDQSTERSTQLIVDQHAPWLEVAPMGIVKEGGTVVVDVHAFFAAEQVSVILPGGTSIALEETAPGRWHGVLEVPANAPVGLQDVEVTAGRADAGPVSQAARLRIVAP